MAIDPESVVRDLRGRVDCPVLGDALTRALYATDASIYQIVPTCVVLPQSIDDLVACVRYAAETGTPIVGRGGGSGLAGESLTSGIVLDCSRYLDRVVETDLDDDWVRCQPGVVLDRLNAALANVGRLFGPDPSSANRATIGGVVANNATGAHSIKYGYTDAYVEELTVVLADGRVERFAAGTLDDVAEGPEDPWAGEIRRIVQANRDLIDLHMPVAKRNRSGYALDKVIRDGNIHLGRLIAGSEGTLALIAEAKLRVVRRPAARGLIQLNFDTLDAMARAVPIAIAHHPSTCETMDGKLMALARQAYPRYRDVLPADVAASLVVEHDGDDLDEVREKLDRTRRAIDSATTAEEVLDPADQQAIWAARKAAVPLLFRRPGPAQPVPFIEDIAVPPDRLAEFIAGLSEILTRHDVEAALYAHAGDGELHTRPFLDLHDPADVAKMRSVALETFRLAWSLGGTISGEHGDGLVRAEFIARQYGPLYDVMRQVKRLFDPDNIMNPGKIICDETGVMTRHLRFEHRRLPERLDSPKLVWGDGELIDEIERCNGNGQCRSLDAAGVMCPTFRALRDEAASPRAHANMLRMWITGRLDESILYSDAFKSAVATCVSCKACHQQCPSAVNVPKLMLEARAQIVSRRGLTFTEWLLARSDAGSALGSATAPLANAVMRHRWFRAVMERLTGIDRRRPMPEFARGAFLRHARRRVQERPLDGEPVGRVAVVFDTYANLHDHRLAAALVDVLLHNRIEVCVPDQVGCQMPAMVYGDVETAKRRLTRNIESLVEAVRDGCMVISAEPTATLCLRAEALDLIDSDDARLVADKTQDACEYLRALHRAGRLRTDMQPIPMTVGYHMPCHLGAMQIGRPGAELLDLVPELTVRPIEAGCCGLAGTFGFQRKAFDVSMAAGERLADALRDERLDAGLTECATCKMQMELVGGKPTWHPIVLLARAYGLTDVP